MLCTIINCEDMLIYTAALLNIIQLNSNNLIIQSKTDEIYRITNYDEPTPLVEIASRDMQHN